MIALGQLGTAWPLATPNGINGMLCLAPQPELPCSEPLQALLPAFNLLLLSVLIGRLYCI